MTDSSEHVDGATTAIRFEKAGHSPAKVRWLAIACLIVQAGLLGFVSGSHLFPGVIVVLAVLAGLTKWRISGPDALQKWLFTSIAFGFFLSHFFFPFDFTLDEHFMGTPVFHVVARILIAVQLVTLFLKSRTDRPPLWLTGVGALCLPVTLNIRVSAQHQQIVLWDVLAYVGIAAMYGSAWRTSLNRRNSGRQWLRASILMSALTTSLLLGGGSALALQRYDRELEWFIGDYLGYRPPSARPGFTTAGRLSDVSNWKITESEEVALVAFSEEAPGYLRGVVFDIYQTPKWDKAWTVWTAEPKLEALPNVKPPRGLKGINPHHPLFRVVEPPQGYLTPIDVELQSSRGPYIFAPLEAAYVSVENGSITSTQHGELRATDRPRPSTYQLVNSDHSPRNVLDGTQQITTTTLDSEVSPEIRRIADDLFADCPTSAEKIDRVQTWFRENFEYRLGIDVPKGENPLTYFLTEKPPAHCEYFATATAVLLRIAGVPSRYVTGYVATERNDIGGYWMARNKDAHAWVEAYDDQSQRWVTVESTPESGRPLPRSAPLWSQVPEAVRHYWTRLQQLVRDHGVGGMLLQLWGVLWSIPGLVTIMLTLFAPLLWRHRRRSGWHRQKEDIRLRSMHALLKRLDRQSQCHDLERRNGETILQFVSRIRESDANPQWAMAMADCYDLYAALRFQGRIGPDAVIEVETALTRVPATTRTSSKLTSTAMT
ncbi:MAG: transglutaminase domain-containing protein [Planctomycetaceae bacterium]|nr:transglutaminase domain-containing protein [Planctomycetaceae bacterium]